MRKDKDEIRMDKGLEEFEGSEKVLSRRNFGQVRSMDHSSNKRNNELRIPLYDELI